MLTPSETRAREVRERPIIFSGPMVRAILAGRKTQTRRPIRDTVPEAPGMDAVHERGTIRHAAPYLDAYCGGKRTPANPRGMGDWWCWWTRDDRACPQFKVGYKPGDRLWVKEGFARVGDNEDDIHACPDLRVHAYYRADAICPEHSKWRSPIFMPRWASRLTLEVTEVRVERLQDIGEADAIAEGATSRPRCSGYGYLSDGWSMDWSRVGQPGSGCFKGRALNESDIALGSAVSAFANFINGLHDPRWNYKGDGIFGANPWVAAITFRPLPASLESQKEGAAV